MTTRLVFGFLPNPWSPISTSFLASREISITPHGRERYHEVSKVFAKADVIPPCQGVLHDTNQLLASLKYPGDVAAILNHEPLLCTHFGFIASYAHAHAPQLHNLCLCA